MIRALSSRRWSERAIRPSGPTGCCGPPLRKPARRLIKDEGGSGGIAAVEPLRLGVQLGLARGEVALARLELELSLALRGRGLVVVVVHQALGLRLKDPQRASASPSQLGKLRGTEEQHDHQEDEDQ